MRRLHATTISGLAAGLVAGMTGCVPPPADPYGQGNVFLEDRPPRYGHGGTQSPGTPPRAYQPPPGYDASQYERSRDGTIFLPSQPTPPPSAPSQGSSAATSPPAASTGGDTGTGAGTSTPSTPPNTGGQTAAAGGAGSAPPSSDAPSTGTAGGGTAPPSTGGGNATDGGAGGTSEPEPPSSSLPFGTPVPGRAGYVYSPYDDKKRFVDVTDIPAGTEVKCPYTGKIFKVP